MMKTSFSRIVAFFFLVLAPLLSLAEQHSSFYVTAALGQSDHGVENAGLNPDDETFIDDRGNAFRLFAGYEFNEYASLEAGYTDLGDNRWGFLISRPDFRQAVNHSETLDGYTLALRLRYPFAERFFLSGRIGGFAWSSEHQVQIVTTDFAANPVSQVSQRTPTRLSGTELTLGVGVGYRVAEDFEVSVDYETLGAAGFPDCCRADFDKRMLTLSLSYRP